MLTQLKFTFGLILHEGGVSALLLLGAHELWWFLQVDIFVLQGRMDDARHLLSKEASANPTSMGMCKILDDLMKKMPILTVCLQQLSHTAPLGNNACSGL